MTNKFIKYSYLLTIKIKIVQMNCKKEADPVEHLIQEFDYVLMENGLVSYENKKQIVSESIVKHYGEEILQEMINFCLEYLSKVRLPKKRGTFIEFRTGMINISPIGRSCTLEERLEFNDYDRKHKIREDFIKILTEKFGEKYQMKFSLGGQISIDAFPIGWDKTYCLKFLEGKFKEIYFFGDRTEAGGNDHELFSHKSVIGIKVNSPEDTITILEERFKVKDE